ncbi:Bacterio-opsin activator HTH domain protein [Haloterrigena turkmenica DSM 5511]|uniref:Bacterio-opsin activator HTH domain protein n=1 Tax=Haloterrigena turkmenica (strain ATCC 51198 / DSM 5511 / JCM 9101 / NCIMB 13204 / VKM B-1734 / 4k) TaxID=543526 RepID=D2RY37_HALTV|nr:helix-turn-helix domain-containing protein [Haloterrigena turkmenica]ADB61783.1 Bacterio-opsin activator HTH domain protein [Haloterrigena turkmenica DSM 5511]
MPTFVEFELPAAETALGETFDRVRSCYCYLERAVVSETPGFWFGGTERLAIEAALEADPTVDAYSRMRAASDEWLYEIRFADEVYELGTLPLEEGGTILAASADRGVWSLRLRFPDHESATRTYRRFLERDVDVDVASVRKGPKTGPERPGLTVVQYETLVAAIERGYYEVPREVSVQELADEFGISDQSVSERLRRASSQILATELNVADANARPDDR